MVIKKLLMHQKKFKNTLILYKFFCVTYAFLGITKKLPKRVSFVVTGL